VCIASVIVLTSKHVKWASGLCTGLWMCHRRVIQTPQSVNRLVHSIKICAVFAIVVVVVVVIIVIIIIIIIRVQQLVRTL